MVNYAELKTGDFAQLGYLVHNQPVCTTSGVWRRECG